MASPDVAAADYAPLWRSRPIPKPGDHVKLRALARAGEGHFFRQVDATGMVSRAEIRSVATAVVSIDELAVTLAGDPLEYVLRESNPACEWTLQATARHDLVDLAPESPAAPAGLPVEDPTSIVTLERRLLQVKNRLRALDGEEKALKDEEAVLSEQIRDTALEQEMESLPAVDGMTAYFSPTYFVKRRIDESTGKEFTSDDIRAALRECGHDYLIAESVNGSQLRGLVREIKIENQQPLPPALARVLDLETRHDVQFTPMGERKRRAAPRRAD
jgi:hypothetical protein